MMRLGHKVIFVAHGGFLYVDDFLWLLERSSSPLQACLLLAMFVAQNVPISWRKLALGTKLEWIGWSLNLQCRIWALPELKLAKALKFLARVSSATSPLTRKELEQGTGFLLWLTCMFPRHRRSLPAFWQCLQWGGTKSMALSCDHVASLVACLSDNAVVIVAPPGPPLGVTGNCWQSAV